jgi:hypothetical protein
VTHYSSASRLLGMKKLSYKRYRYAFGFKATLKVGKGSYHLLKKLSKR